MAGSQIGIVVIGRNEGERLKVCLQSMRVPTIDAGQTAARTRPVVYVDSGSSDGSVALARSMGAQIVELEMNRPFTAARARNEGCARLRQIAPDTQYVQFVDGDCAMAEGWLELAEVFLNEHPQCAAVAGRLRERHPERSTYNRLCDIEWNTQPGEIGACGGIAMYRIGALKQVNGFKSDMIAGEEPELCFRLREAGWHIYRHEAEMALHDAAMTRLAQWWKRATRAGYAYALGASLHSDSPERYRVKETLSIWLWGLVVPVLGVVLAVPTQGISLILLCGYPMLACRVYRYMRGRDFPAREAGLYACFCVLAKFPQLQGQLRFWLGWLRSKPSGLIEYKAVQTAGGKL